MSVIEYRDASAPHKTQVVDADHPLPVDGTITAEIANGLEVAVPDGADVTQGAKADAAVTDPTATATEMAFLKGLAKLFNSFANLVTAQVTVGNTQTLLCAARVTAARVVTILNTHDTDTLYVGPTGVTTGNGFPVPAGRSRSYTVTAAIYGIRGANAIVAGVDEEYI
jgi:hypothetical protein